MADVIYTEFDDKEVKEFLNQIDSRLKNIKGGKKEYTGLLSAIVYADVVKHFEDEQGSKGPWKKWSTSYKDKMEKIGKLGNQILQDTGRLRNTFKPTKVRKTNIGFLWFNDAKTKSGFPYAAAHDNGGDQLPQRDFMWLSDKAMDKVEIQTLQFLLEKGI
jgi:phage gpG-like protein